MLSVAFSHFEEERFAIQNIKKIKQILKKFNFKYEILVIDDYSKVFPKKLEIFCKKNKVRFFRNEYNCGFFKCFVKGLVESKYENYKFFAGDDCTNTNDIIKIFSYIGKYDLIIPFNIQSEVKGKPKFRKILSYIYTHIVNFLSGYKIKYYNGLPLYRKKKALLNLPDTSGYGWQAELIINCLNNNCSYVELLTRNKEIKFVYNSIKLKNVPSVLFSLIKILFKRISPSRIKKIKLKF